MPGVFPQRRHKAFSLVELLVSAAIMAALLLILLAVSNQVSSIWRLTAGKIEQFRHSREAFDRISRRLSQATLNTYWDYDDPAAPSRYVRQSELRFLSGPTETLTGLPPEGRRRPGHGLFFQATLGMAQPGQGDLAGLNSLLNTWGYFVEFGSNADFRPAVLDASPVPPSYRFRLCELIQPADKVSLYDHTSGRNPDGTPKASSYAGNDWFAPAANASGATRPVHVLAENVIALIILPKLSGDEDPSGTALAPNFTYDSTATRSDPALNPKNQLPPQVTLTMVALDENSAKRIEEGSSMPDLGLDGLFLTASEYENDLNKLREKLTKLSLDFRIFTTTVPLREARWSNEQAN